LHSFRRKYEELYESDLKKFNEFVEKLGVRSSILDKDPLHRVIASLTEAYDALEEDSSSDVVSSPLRVIDVFLVPKFRYDPIKKQFHQYVSCSLLFFFSSIFLVLINVPFVMTNE